MKTFTVLIFMVLLILMAPLIFSHDYFDLLPPLNDIPFIFELPRVPNKIGEPDGMKHLPEVIVPGVGLVDFKTYFIDPISESYGDWKSARMEEGFETKMEFSNRVNSLKNNYQNAVRKFANMKYYIFFRIKLEFEKKHLLFTSRTKIFDSGPMLTQTSKRRKFCWKLGSYDNKRLIPSYDLNISMYCSDKSCKHGIDFISFGKYHYLGDNIQDCSEFHEKHEPYLVFVFEYRLTKSCDGKELSLSDWPFYIYIEKISLLNHNNKSVLATWSNQFDTSLVPR